MPKSYKGQTYPEVALPHLIRLMMSTRSESVEIREGYRGGTSLLAGI